MADINRKSEEIKWAKNPYAFVSVLFNSDPNHEPVSLDTLRKYFNDYNEFDSQKQDSFIEYLVERETINVKNGYVTYVGKTFSAPPAF